MPIYEFKCKCCENEFETLLLTSTAEGSVLCPKCYSGDLERIPSVCSIASGQTSGAGSSCKPRPTGFS